MRSLIVPCKEGDVEEPQRIKTGVGQFLVRRGLEDEEGAEEEEHEMGGLKVP